MKKEKQVKTYQRRTKSGKVVTVKAHTAKYDAAEKAKEAAKKKGSGSELAAKKGSVKEAISSRSKKEAELIREQLEKYGGKKGKEIAKEEPKTSAKKATTKKTTEKAPSKKKISRPVGSGTNGPENKSSGVSSAEFKAWYHDPKSKEGKAAAKKLKEQVGAEKYKELNKKANASYSSRGHLSLFKGLSSAPATKTSSQKAVKESPKTLGRTPLASSRKEAVKSWISDAENSFKKYQDAVKSNNASKIAKAKRAYLNDMDYLYDHEAKAYNKLHKKHGLDTIKEDMKTSGDSIGKPSKESMRRLKPSGKESLVKRSPELAALHYYKTTGKQHPNGFKVKETGKGFSVTPPADIKGKTNAETKKLFDAYGNRKSGSTKKK